MKKQMINCDVFNCKFNDIDNQKCKLDEINISCDCNSCKSEKCVCKKDTICSSYEEKK